jgi:uncharacterized protein (TIGR02118 family)
MIKLVYLVSRRPGLPEAEFYRYWKEVHGPLGARIPGVRRLVQSHAPHALGNPRPNDFDGMAELWFDDLDALLAARESSEWRVSAEGEARFIDEGRVAYFIAEEHEISLTLAAPSALTLALPVFAEPETRIEQAPAPRF